MLLLREKENLAQTWLHMAVFFDGAGMGSRSQSDHVLEIWKRLHYCRYIETQKYGRDYETEHKTCSRYAKMIDGTLFGSQSRSVESHDVLAGA